VIIANTTALIVADVFGMSNILFYICKLECNYVVYGWVFV